MSFIHIQKKKIPKGDSLVEVYAVSAVAITSPQGKILIPNPAGQEACVYGTLVEAEEAVRRAGFDYVFEGQKTYTLQKSPEAAVKDGRLLSLEDSIPLLIQRLGDREPSVLANAAFALGELGAIQAIKPLAQHLGHEDVNVRKEVAEALAKMGRSSLPILIKAFTQSQKSFEKNAAHIRLTVMTAFLELTHRFRELLPEVLPQTIEALNDENWLVRAQAALVVGRAAQFLKEEK